jgi:hypothetical protein
MPVVDHVSHHDPIAGRSPSRPAPVLTGGAVIIAVATLVCLLVGLSGSAGATTLTPPAVPTNSAYLGAFVAPDQGPTVSQSDIRVELSLIGDFEGVLGRPLGIVHVYQDWHDPVRSTALAALASSGATPMVDWSCTSDASIISGSQDSLITSYATTLKDYGHPVFLRWFWEMNLVGLTRTQGCLGTLGAAGYVQAWQHIWTIFQQVGATNVSFVWCPSVINTAAAYYPGSNYVDWIAFDGYDRKQDPAIITTEFEPFTSYWASQGKPMMIAETGATTDQAAYLAALATEVPEDLPGVKAVVYYDSQSTSNWTLADSPGNLGLEQFFTLGELPYFAFPFAGS